MRNGSTSPLGSGHPDACRGRFSIRTSRFPRTSWCTGKINSITQRSVRSWSWWVAARLQPGTRGPQRSGCSKRPMRLMLWCCGSEPTPPETIGDAPSRSNDDSIPSSAKSTTPALLGSTLGCYSVRSSRVSSARGNVVTATHFVGAAASLGCRFVGPRASSCAPDTTKAGSNFTCNSSSVYLRERRRTSFGATSSSSRSGRAGILGTPGQPPPLSAAFRSPGFNTTATSRRHSKASWHPDALWHYKMPGKAPCESSGQPHGLRTRATSRAGVRPARPYDRSWSTRQVSRPRTAVRSRVRCFKAVPTFPWPTGATSTGRSGSSAPTGFGRLSRKGPGSRRPVMEDTMSQRPGASVATGGAARPAAPVRAPPPSVPNR